MSEKRQPRQQRGQQPSPLRYAGMGFELAAAIIGCTLVGLWVDHQFGTGRKGLTVGAVVGIVGGLYNFIREALRLSKQQKKTGKLPGSGSEALESTPETDRKATDPERDEHEQRPE